MKHTETAELLGLSFDAVTMETAVARCLDLCRGPRTSHTVITANASHLCMMRRDPELALACRAGSSHRGRRHVGGMGSEGLGPAGPGASGRRGPYGAPPGGSRGAPAARLLPRR